VYFFQEWQQLLEVASDQVTVYTDHKNLEYFMIARILNCHQARWNISLSQFNFVITYRPRKQQGFYDAWFRRSSLASKEEKAAYEQQQTTRLEVEQIRLCAATMSTLVDSSFLDQIRVASTMDPLVLDIKHFDNNREKFKFVDDVLYFEEHLYKPEGPTRLRVLQARHDFPVAGHFGFNKTLELISQDFWWLQMWKAVKEFVLSCDTCSRSKNPRHCPYGLLQPLPI
jgi:hypothetical protein